MQLAITFKVNTLICIKDSIYITMQCDYIKHHNDRRKFMILKKKQDSKAKRKHKGQEGLFQSVTNEGCDRAVHIHFHLWEMKYCKHHIFGCVI